MPHQCLMSLGAGTVELALTERPVDLFPLKPNDVSPLWYNRLQLGTKRLGCA